MTAKQLLQYTAYGFLITFALIVIRMAWVYLYHGIIIFYTQKKNKSTLSSSQILKESAIIGWSGMRGIVSLAMALALPYKMLDNTPLAGRDEVLFITFVVILLTLLITGFSLPWLIHKLKFKTFDPMMHIMNVARRKLSKIAHEEIEKLYEKGNINQEDKDFLITYFCTHNKILEISSAKHTSVPALEVARIKVIDTQRKNLIKMWENGEIDEKQISRLEHELDIEETHLARGEIF